MVDDEPGIVRALGINLKALGYQIDAAANGEDALRKAADHRPDAVILDLGLPGIDGIDVIRGLRGWTNIPIIVLSVREAEREKIAALDAGADDYVTKPFGMGELLARLRAALRREPDAGADLPTIVTEDFTIDLAVKRVTKGRAGGQAHADRVGRCRGSGPSPGKTGEPDPASQRGLGSPVRGGNQLSPGLHCPGAAEARTPAQQSPLLHHRTRHGLPVPNPGNASTNPGQ